MDEKLNPILEDIEQIRTYLRNVQDEDSRKFDIIISSYRFRLCQLCKIYLDRGYMTPSDYEQLNEFYKTYTGLGGNGAAKEWYEKVKVLPVHEHPIKKKKKGESNKGFPHNFIYSICSRSCNLSRIIILSSGDIVSIILRILSSKV